MTLSLLLPQVVNLPSTQETQLRESQRAEEEGYSPSLTGWAPEREVISTMQCWGIPAA